MRTWKRLHVQNNRGSFNIWLDEYDWPPSNQVELIELEPGDVIEWSEPPTPWKRWLIRGEYRSKPNDPPDTLSRLQNAIDSLPDVALAKWQVEKLSQLF